MSRAQRKTVVTHFLKNVQEEGKTFHIAIETKGIDIETKGIEVETEGIEIETEGIEMERDKLIAILVPF